MYYRIIIASISVAATLSASEAHHTGIAHLISQQPTDKTLVWHNKNLSNDDLTHCSNIYEQVTELDISNNSFTGPFPLQKCLCIFPKLEILKINNNNINGFACDDTWKNTTLQELHAENTACTEIPLASLYLYSNLALLNISNLTKLDKIVMPWRPRQDDTKGLQVCIKNVVFQEKQLEVCRKKGIFDSHRARSFKILGAIGFGILGIGIVTTTCLTDGYCASMPFPVRNDHDPVTYVNALMFDSATTTLSCVLGYNIGKAIAHCYLPNHGKVAAITFTPNLLSDTVDTL